MGQDGFDLSAKSSVGLMSRSLKELNEQATGASHPTPDGMFMFTYDSFADLAAYLGVSSCGG